MPKSNAGHRNGSPDAADTLTPTRLVELGGSIPISQVQELRKIPSALPSLFPPSPVQGLAVTYPASTSIRLAWSAPADNGGSAVLGYKVSVVDQSTGSPVYSSASYDASPLTVTGLTTGTGLTASVFAVNAIGQGSGSSIAATTRASAPGAPTGLAGTGGDTQAALAWTAPSSDGGAAITGYVIEYTPSGGSATTVSTGVTSPSFTLSGLTNGTAHSIRVAAVNSVGQGSYSSAVSVTPAGVPGAPTALAATSGTDSAVPLAWTAPASNGGASITGYVVEWTPSGGSASTVSTGSASTNYTKSGLTNNTEYGFRVAAVNSVGQGAWSSSVTGRPAASGPVFSGISTSSSSPDNAYTSFTASGSGTATLAISNVVSSGRVGYHIVTFTISESAMFSYDDLHYTGSYSYDSGDVTTQLTSVTNPGGGGWFGRKSGGYGFPLPYSYDAQYNRPSAATGAAPARFILPAGSYKLEFTYIGNGAPVKTMNVTFALSSPTNSVGKSFADYNAGWNRYQGIGTNTLIIYKQTGSSRSIYWTPNTTATTIRLVIPAGSNATVGIPASSSSTLYPGWTYDSKYGQWRKTGLSGITLDVPVAAFSTGGSASDKHINFQGDTSGPVTATIVN